MKFDVWCKSCGWSEITASKVEFCPSCGGTEMVNRQSTKDSDPLLESDKIDNSSSCLFDAT